MYKLKKLLKELEKYRGRHTELISVYVPQGYNLNLIQTQLFQEQGTASNIKSSSTRKNVINALGKILQELKLYKSNMPNGMAIFCGNVSEKNDLKLWVLEPPKPLKVKLYRCDQKFILDPLKEMLRSDKIYGLIVMDNQNAAIGILNGKSIIVEKEMTSLVPGKYRAGGQSAARFERVRENLKKSWYKDLMQEAMKIFSKEDNLKGILVGGPGPTKNNFVDLMPQHIRKKVIGVVDIGYSDANALNELVNQSESILEQEEVMQEKKILKEFFQKLSKNPNLITYGEKQTIDALKAGAVEKVIISEEVDDKTIEFFEEEIKNYSSEITIISTDTVEGKQFYQIGGIGAFLRYEIGV